MRERERARNAWRLNCEQIARYDTELVEKENEIATLKSLLEAEKLRTRSRVSSESPLGEDSSAAKG